MRIKTFAAAVMLCSVTVAPSAFAQKDSLKLDAVRSEQAEIRAGVEHRTGIYKDLSPASREQLLAKQTQLLGLIEGKPTADDLSQTQRDEVTTTLATIRGIVSKAADERLVCERRATLGSNRKERVCRTVAQIREDQEAARNAMSSGNVCSDCKSN